MRRLSSIADAKHFSSYLNVPLGLIWDEMRKFKPKTDKEMFNTLNKVFRVFKNH